MKKTFIKTKNVKKFISLMNNLENRAEGVPGMALVYGDPGLGKTQTINWWAFQNDVILVRCTQLMSSKWLLTEILNAMGEYSSHKISECFNHIVRCLLLTPRTLIIDEVDYLINDSKIIETLRDIHDKTNVPIVLVGMASLNNKLKAYKHLYDRFSEIIEFETFSKEDIKQIIEELSEVEITDCAIKFIYSHVNRFRQIVKIINKAEIMAQSNCITTIDEILLKEVINSYGTENLESNKNPK